MTTITIATRTKPNPDSKVGIGFARTNDGRITITRIQDSGLFAGSGLLPGQELLSINGTEMRGKSLDVVLVTLKSIEGQVTINAGPGKQSARLSCSLTTRGTKVTLDFNSSQISQVPAFLGSMGVSKRKWSRLAESFQTELLPSVQQLLTMDQILASEMNAYTSKQMGKGYVGFGQESNHEKKVFMMTHQAAILHSNLILVANNILCKANALLNGNGVMAELEYTLKTLPNYSSKQTGRNTISIPTMILFTPIGDNGTGLGTSVNAVSSPIANATVVPVNNETDC